MGTSGESLGMAMWTVAGGSRAVDQACNPVVHRG
jgi:hypothetical protein